MILITAKNLNAVLALHFNYQDEDKTGKFQNIFLYCPLRMQLENTKHTIRSNVQRTAMKGLNKSEQKTPHNEVIK